MNAVARDANFTQIGLFNSTMKFVNELRVHHLCSDLFPAPRGTKSTFPRWILTRGWRAHPMLKVQPSNRSFNESRSLVRTPTRVWTQIGCSEGAKGPFSRSPVVRGEPRKTFNSPGIITFAGGESIAGLGTVPITHLLIQSPVSRWGCREMRHTNQWRSGSRLFRSHQNSRSCWPSIRGGWNWEKSNGDSGRRGRGGGRRS